MSDILGYSRAVQYNNDAMSRDKGIQDALRNRNLENLTNHNVVERQSDIMKKAESNKSKNSGNEEAGSFLNDARNIYKTGKKLNNIYETTGKAIEKGRRNIFLTQEPGSEESRGVVSVADQAPRSSAGFTRPYDDTNVGDVNGGVPNENIGESTSGRRLAGALDGSEDMGADIDAVLNFRLPSSAIDRATGVDRGVADAGLAERVSNPIAGLVRSAPEVNAITRSVGAVGDSVSIAARSAQVGDLSSVIENSARAINSTKNIVSSLDSLGKAGEGLSVVAGVSDIIDDQNGGFHKMNTAEKVGNVAGITAGAAGLMSLATGLEQTGAVLDATGFGAEIGVGLQVAGGVAAGVSAIADYVGSEMKQKSGVSVPATQQMSSSLNNAPKISSAQSGMIASSQPY